MKKILALTIMVLFLASCALGPGEATSKSIEDIQVTVSPPAANYKIELYSGSVLMGTAATNSKGIATFSNLPIGAYKTVVFSPSGVKATEKYLTSVYVSGPTPFKVFVNVPAVATTPVVPPPSPTPVVVTVPTPPPVLVCTPNQVTCKSANTKSVCNAAGTAFIDTVCVAPNNKCLPGTGCVQCTSNTDCTAGQVCTNNVCTAAQVCTPNQITCKNANTKSVCNAAGTALTDTVCTAPKDKCLVGVGCVECTSNAQCTSGICQNNVCAPAPACVRCPYPRTDCKWLFKNLCTPLGEGGYPICTAFIFYNPMAACSWTNNLGIVPTDTYGTITVPGRVTPVPIRQQYECCVVGGTTTTTTTPPSTQVSTTPTPPPAPVHCPNGVVETNLGEECEPPGTATCDANCKNIPEPLPPQPVPPVCGNHNCETGETASSCPQDCGTPQVFVSSVDTANIFQCYSPGYSGGHLTAFSRGPGGCSGVPLETNLGFLLTRISSGLKAADVAEIALCKHTYGGSGTSLVNTYYENEIAYDGVLCSPETRPSEYYQSVVREFIGYAFKSYVPGTRLAYKCAKTTPLYNFRVSFDSKCHADDNYYTTDVWGVRTYPWKDYHNVGTLGYWPVKSSLP